MYPLCSLSTIKEYSEYLFIQGYAVTTFLYANCIIDDLSHVPIQMHSECRLIFAIIHHDGNGDVGEDSSLISYLSNSWVHQEPLMTLSYS